MASAMSFIDSSSSEKLGSKKQENDRHSMKSPESDIFCLPKNMDRSQRVNMIIELLMEFQRETYWFEVDSQEIGGPYFTDCDFSFQISAEQALEEAVTHTERIKNTIRVLYEQDRSIKSDLHAGFDSRMKEAGVPDDKIAVSGKHVMELRARLLCWQLWKNALLKANRKPKKEPEFSVNIVTEIRSDGRISDFKTQYLPFSTSWINFLGSLADATNTWQVRQMGYKDGLRLRDGKWFCSLTPLEALRNREEVGWPNIKNLKQITEETVYNLYLKKMAENEGHPDHVGFFWHEKIIELSETRKGEAIALQDRVSEIPENELLGPDGLPLFEPYFCWNDFDFTEVFEKTLEAQNEE